MKGNLELGPIVPGSRSVLALTAGVDFTGAETREARRAFAKREEIHEKAVRAQERRAAAAAKAQAARAGRA